MDLFEKAQWWKVIDSDMMAELALADLLNQYKS